MTIAELKILIEDLPDEMSAFVEAGEGAFIPACRKQSGVFPVIEDEIEGYIFLLRPCTCNNDIQLPVVPEINLN